jgi:hypothetical protein
MSVERIVMADLTVYKNRTNVIQVHLGFNVSADTITSEIRDKAKELLATWVVSFLTDGTDGKLVLTLDNANLANLTAKTGLMDFKRMSNGEPLPLIDEPIDVTFKDTITV